MMWWAGVVCAVFSIWMGIEVWTGQQSLKAAPTAEGKAAIRRRILTSTVARYIFLGLAPVFLITAPAAPWAVRVIGLVALWPLGLLLRTLVRLRLRLDAAAVTAG